MWLNPNIAQKGQKESDSAGLEGTGTGRGATPIPIESRHPADPAEVARLDPCAEQGFIPFIHPAPYLRGQESATVPPVVHTRGTDFESRRIAGQWSRVESNHHSWPGFPLPGKALTKGISH